MHVWLNLAQSQVIVYHMLLFLHASKTACKYSLDWHSTDCKTKQYTVSGPQAGHYLGSIRL